MNIRMKNALVMVFCVFSGNFLAQYQNDFNNLPLLILLMVNAIVMFLGCWFLGVYDD